MTALWQSLRRFDTLALRLTLVLAIGGTLASMYSLTFSEWYLQHQMRQYRAEMIARSVADIAGHIAANDHSDMILLASNRIRGAHLLQDASAPVLEADPAIDQALSSGLPRGMTAHSFRTDPAVCAGHPGVAYVRAVAGMLAIPPECWAVDLGVLASDGQVTHHRMAFDMAPLPLLLSVRQSPDYLALVALAALLLSFLVASITLRFMRRLAVASRAFSSDIAAAPIPETGPRDVRETFAAFNQMQQRIREAMQERAQILAAISHDLQTPLTRLRLRLDLLPDEGVRTRLFHDVEAMQRLVTEGLALARSGESADDWVMLDMESLLASMVEDMTDAGLGEVTLGHVDPVEVRVKPDALHRCLQNLIDNALRYGGQARLDCRQEEGRIVISVTDAGPGIPEALLDQMFEPFVRGDSSRSRRTGGTGIGLTIARAQAATFGASVSLANAAQGGLIARITIPLPTY
ncbi:ATP-binding protein [Novosphingobium sp.]|uniref:ATP-binding protein n=1 Tax=Novosphingobium sp. TaxID=1874826 RepID=UPI0031E3A5AE